MGQENMVARGAGVEGAPRDRSMAKIERNNAPNYYAHSGTDGRHIPFVETPQKTAQHLATKQWGTSLESPWNHETQTEPVARIPMG